METESKNKVNMVLTPTEPIYNEWVTISVSGLSAET